MAVRSSKQVINLTRECDFVLSAFRTEGDNVAEALTGLTTSNPEVTEGDPGYASVFRDMGGRMETSIAHLKASDRKLMAAIGWESTLRKEHSDMSEEQGFVLVGMRGAVIAHYVGPDLENLSLQPIDVRDSVTVSYRSQLVADRFEAPNLATMLGRPRFGISVDFTPYVAQLRGSARDLALLRGKINEAERLTARARLDKNRIQVAHDKLVLRSARVFEDFCRLAGFDELADKIRRTVRSRPSSEEPGLDGPGVDEPGLDGSGLDGPGLDGSGLDGPGLDGPGLDGPGLVQPGLDGPEVGETGNVADLIGGLPASPEVEEALQEA